MPNTWTAPTVSDGKYVSTYTADQAQTSGYSIIFNTANTFVDKNIQAKVIIPEGHLSASTGSVSITASNTGSGFLTESAQQPVDVPFLTITGSGTVGVNQAGWIGTTASESSNSATKYYTLTAAGSFSFDSSTRKVTSGTAGFITANTDVYTIPAGTITNPGTKPSGTSSSGTINRGNYIKIGAGYYNTDKYYLAQPNEGTYTVTAAGTNINIDGKATLNVASGALEVSGGDLNAGAGSGTLTNKGYYNGSTYDTADTIDITSQTAAAAGYYKLTASGYGSVSRDAINKQITTAGWLAKDNSAVQVFASTSINSNTGTTDYYVKKSTLSTSSITSSNSQQTVTVYAGYYPTNRTITINAMTTRTPTTAYTNTGMSTYFTATTLANNDADVVITPNYSTSAGYVAAASATNNGGIGYWKINTATPAFDGGAITTTTQASANTGTSIVTTAPDTYSNGVTIQTKYLSNRAVVQYNGAVNGWVTAANDATALAATNNSSYTNGQLYYLTQVTVPKDKKFTVITTADTALDSTSTLSITNNAFRNTTITNAGTVYAQQTTSGKGILYGRAYGEDTDQLLINNGAWNTSTLTSNTSADQVAYGKVIVKKISGANIYTSQTDPGNTYTSPSPAPVVPSGGYLVLDAGFYGNTKISLADLVPDSINNYTIATSQWIHPSYAAFGADGEEIIGSMALYAGAYTLA